MKQTVVFTDSRMAEARDAQAYLRAGGYRVETVPEDVCLWDEYALRSFAMPLAPSLWNRSVNEGPLAACCVTKVFCGLMKEHGGGSMIYLNSIHAEKPVGMGSLFSMGCAATQMLAREANQDYGEFNVRTFFIQKGIASTDPDSKSPVSALYFGADLRYPQRKMPEEGYLNGLISFLLTPQAAPLSGADLRADGGMTMYYTHRRKVEGRPYFDDLK